MNTVDKETLKSWLGQSDLFLMDVRTRRAWEASISKIEHARRFDPDKLPKMAKEIPQNKKLVLYCEDGQTACPSLSQDLEKMGFSQVFVLEGGFRAWTGKEFPVVPKELE